MPKKLLVTLLMPCFLIACGQKEEEKKAEAPAEQAAPAKPATKTIKVAPDLPNHPAVVTEGAAFTIAKKEPIDKVLTDAQRSDYQTTLQALKVTGPYAIAPVLDKSEVRSYECMDEQHCQQALKDVNPRAREGYGILDYWVDMGSLGSDRWVDVYTTTFFYPSMIGTHVTECAAIEKELKENPNSTDWHHTILSKANISQNREGVDFFDLDHAELKDSRGRFGLGFGTAEQLQQPGVKRGKYDIAAGTADQMAAIEAYARNDQFQAAHEDAICKEVMAKYAPKIQPGQRQIIHVKSGSLK